MRSHGSSNPGGVVSHGVELFLNSYRTLSQSKYYLPLEPQGLLPCLQQPATWGADDFVSDIFYSEFLLQTQYRSWEAILYKPSATVSISILSFTAGLYA